MAKIVVFGAGGKAGRKTVSEATRRGHQVTAVVRDPAKHDFDAAVTVVAGDVTQAASVAEVAAGHDAVVQAAYQPDVPVSEFFPSAAAALVEGLGKAGVTRLAVVGIGTELEVSPGVKVHDTPGFPDAGKEFSLAHVAELEVLQNSGSGLDWVVIAPPPVVLDNDADAAPFRTGGSELIAAETFSYASLAVAIVDEIDRPLHSRQLVAIG